ncbi:uncharacterized protein PG986_012912 [Apiospora aurea]|uniref:Fungal N-terminal domain-containing protein n=1 Tax=Apiospora aurea TaxID=335848 RepID=A0ABR1Q1C0_9PEZI
MKASYSEVEDTTEVDYSLTLADCQSINILQSKLRKGRSALECCQDLARGLETSWRAIGTAYGIKINSETVVGLDLYATEMASYSKCVESLLERSYDIGGLISRILKSREVEKDRKTSQAIEKSIHALEGISKESSETSRTLANVAQETSKDSLTLKALTLIATIYLPATLTASKSTMGFPDVTAPRDSTFEFRQSFGSDSCGLEDHVQYDLITVLAVAQKLGIEILALTWQSARE